MLNHTGLEVVANGPDRYAFKEFIHMDMTSEPCILLHVKTGFHIRILAIGECRNKQINGNKLSCFYVHI